LKGSYAHHYASFLLSMTTDQVVFGRYISQRHIRTCVCVVIGLYFIASYLLPTVIENSLVTRRRSIVGVGDDGVGWVGVSHRGKSYWLHVDHDITWLWPLWQVRFVNDILID
jgi:hypothetical protein